jgi:ADP-heptose:LPS heptosyltransferase
MLQINKIIIIQLQAIGDTLMCEPAVSALKKTYKQAEITFITSNAAYDILRHNKNISRIIVWNKNMNWVRFLVMLLSLTKKRYDLLVDFQKNPRTFIMSHFIRSKVKLSYKSKRRNYIYNDLKACPSLDKYIAFEKVRMVSEYLPNGFKPEVPRIYITDEDRNKARKIFLDMGFDKQDFVIAVSPISRATYRTWNAHNFSMLCDSLFRKYAVKYLFTWGPGEKHIVDEVVNNMETHKPATNFAIDSLKTLYALFELADMYLGNDNGPRHIAIAAGLPSICIFSHFYGSYWTPPNTGRHLYVEPKQKTVEKGQYRISSVDYSEAEITCDKLITNLQLKTRRRVDD